MSAREVDRREFLQVLGAGIVVLVAANDLHALEEMVGGEALPGAPPDFNAYLHIAENGRVTVFSGKIEMGQGVTTSLAQMAAEELGVSVDAIDMVMGDTRLCPWDGGTNGSRSIKYFGPALRAAGAEAREVLIQLACEQLNIPAARLAAQDGFLVDREADGVRVAYGALVKGQRIERRLEAKPPLKTAAQFKVMGKALPRRDSGGNPTPNALAGAWARVGLEFPLNELRACWKMGASRTQKLGPPRAQASHRSS